MPILNIVIRGDNVNKKTIIRTERPIKLTYLKLTNTLHNLDAYNLSDVTDKKQQRLLFVRFGGLLDAAAKTISYVGDWNGMVAGATQNFKRVDYDHIHGFLVGTTKHNNSGAIAEKENFQVLYEDHEAMNWDGQFSIELFYLDKEGKLKAWDHGNVYSSGNKSSTSFIAFQFEYHEQLN